MGGAAQRGATLIVGLIMMVLITVIVINAFTLSSSNMRSVGNTQVREEAIAAANTVVEQVITAGFTSPPLGSQTVAVDINKDLVNDYTVVVSTPVCTRAVRASVSEPSDPPTLTGGDTWNTDWDLEATVTDAASGASVKIHHGVRVQLPELQRDVVCPATGP